MSDPRAPVTLLLRDLSRGRPRAADELLAAIYGELRGLAGAVFARQGGAPTLQPTALVNEAWLRLVDDDGDREWDGRRHFFAVAAKAMRQVLSNHARDARAQKRGGEWARVTLDPERDGGAPPELDLVALDDALTKLGRANEKYVRVFELRYLAGLDTGETARALELSERSVQLAWRATRAFLAEELGDGV